MVLWQLAVWTEEETENYSSEVKHPSVETLVRFIFYFILFFYVMETQLVKLEKHK